MTKVFFSFVKEKCTHLFQIWSQNKGFKNHYLIPDLEQSLQFFGGLYIWNYKLLIIIGKSFVFFSTHIAYKLCSKSRNSHFAQYSFCLQKLQTLRVEKHTKLLPIEIIDTSHNSAYFELMPAFDFSDCAVGKISKDIFNFVLSS